MKVIYNGIIPFRGFTAVNLCGVVFARRGAVLDNVILNHERIHTAQIKECLVIGFYLIYLLNWIVNLFRYGFSMEAYRQIAFEKEAYDNQRDMNYLAGRKLFAWM